MKLAKTSKMPCKSWSLEAIATCPASIDPETGELVPACQGCYATTGFYLMDSVKAPRIYNKADWKRSDWVSDMVHAIKKDKLFRWFDSGDMYSVKLAHKILEVMIKTPNTQHWLPTRMHKFPKFENIIRVMNMLPNVVVRLSSDSIHGEIIDGEFTSTIFDGDQPDQPENAHICPAYQQEGKCGDCRACWDKDVSLIAYPQHGRKMKKINIQIAA